MGYKPIRPTALDRDDIFVMLDSKQTCPLLGRETLSSKAVLYTIILDKIVGKKAIRASLLTRHAET